MHQVKNKLVGDTQAMEDPPSNDNEYEDDEKGTSFLKIKNNEKKAPNQRQHSRSSPFNYADWGPPIVIASIYYLIYQVVFVWLRW